MLVPGQKYGKLIAIRPADKIGNRTAWLFKCVCGKEIARPITRVLHGRNLSCSKACGQLVHGHARIGKISTEFRSYVHARERCISPANKDYSYYGGRGIEFRFNSFEEFYDELGPKPSPKHSVDRIDNNGHYESGNVRWATKREQMNNTRRQNVNS